MMQLVSPKNNKVILMCTHIVSCYGEIGQIKKVKVKVGFTVFIYMDVFCQL